MIFNEKLVKSLFFDVYSENEDITEVTRLIHENTSPLIGSIAYSVTKISNHDTSYNDLVQEGHLKLQLILQKHSYVEKQGTLYSFLSKVLRNSMIDLVRKDTKEIVKDIKERPGENTEEQPNIEDDMISYIILRFPSVSDYLSLIDATMYIHTALCESVKNKSWGIVRTLVYSYSYDRKLSFALYRSCVIYMRAKFKGCLNFPDHPEKFLRDNPKYEKTNIPDMALIIGRLPLSDMMESLKGMRLKI